MTCAVLLRSYRTKYRLTTPYRIRCLSSTPRRQNDDDDDHFNPNPRTVTPPWLNKDGQLGMLNDAPEAPRIAVVGAGLTGLTAAYYLAQYLPKAKITLYEADNRVGGWMRSDEREVDVGTEKKKVIFERGPRSMSPGDAIHDQQDRLVLYDMLADHGISHTPGPKRLARYLYHPDRLVGMPPQNPLAKFIHEPLFRAIAPGGLWWALKWQFRTAKTFLKEDVSVADYVRHASRSPKLADMMSAGIHGVWGGDIEKLSAVSVFSWFFHRSTMLPDYNELFMPRRHTEDAFVKAFLKEKPHLKHMYENYKPSILTFGEFGIETLPKALEHTLTEADNVEMKMGNGVREISYVQEKDQVEVSRNIPVLDERHADKRYIGQRHEPKRRALRQSNLNPPSKTSRQHNNPPTNPHETLPLCLHNDCQHLLLNPQSRSSRNRLPHPALLPRTPQPRESPRRNVRQQPPHPAIRLRGRHQALRPHGRALLRRHGTTQSGRSHRTGQDAAA